MPKKQSSYLEFVRRDYQVIADCDGKVKSKSASF